jgi:hypothetical protein
MIIYNSADLSVSSFSSVAGSLLEEDSIRANRGAALNIVKARVGSEGSAFFCGLSQERKSLSSLKIQDPTYS